MEKLKPLSKEEILKFDNLKQYVKYEATRRGMSLSKFAEEIDVSHPTVLGWDKRNVWPASLKKLSDYLDVDIFALDELQEKNKSK